MDSKQSLSILPKLLSLLSDGEFHSGTSVGQVMGVTRTAVWKHLQKLADMGLLVESVKGKGYRVEGGIELLSKEAITQSLREDVKGKLRCLDVFLDVKSTNDIAMNRALVEGSAGYVCLAEYQSAGRGRRGREWVSPFGHNIYLSLVWEFSGGVNQLEGLSLAVGVSVSRVLTKMGLSGVSLKWPNDVLLNGKKLGGILLEMTGDPSGICRVVVGVGLNVRMEPNVAIDQPWAAISEELPDISKNRLVSSLLNDLLPVMHDYHVLGFQSYKDEWGSFDAYKGLQVRVISGQNSLEGKAQGVDDTGALLLQGDGWKKAIYGGEVSLRRLNDS